ncbi:PREDICTED: uncharacterized protein LOC104713993 [Camelina sativa]|uniref:Uncharacterized protein LOC104713993 n=1 Tax=Camelina sativa TaxID=90675 RepID=A0ABM1QG99_CAMSA|nr:PREDICTED: uncharacterized protein LOC104713993 [Camelina sativa]
MVSLRYPSFYPSCLKFSISINTCPCVELRYKKMKGNLWLIASFLVLLLAIFSCEASTPPYGIRKLLNIKTPPSGSKPAPQFRKRERRTLELPSMGRGG